MNNLLSANFARLWRSAVLWLGVLFMLALAVFVMLSEALAPQPQNSADFDVLYFGYSQILGFCCAVFASLFLGTEYENGTIRNKLIAGHSRRAVYLASLATVFAASLIMMAAWLLGGLAGLPFFGFWSNPAGCLVNWVVSLFTTAAFSAIFTLVAMLCTSRAVSAVASVVLYLGLSMFAGSIRLDLVRDLLPTGHVLWVSGAPAGGPSAALLGAVLLPLLGSVLITAGATCAGSRIFQKKDLK